MLERVLERSMMAFLFNTERLARDRSAVTRVMEILQEEEIMSGSAPPLDHFMSKNSRGSIAPIDRGI